MELRPFELSDLYKFRPRGYVEYGVPMTSKIVSIDTGISETMVLGDKVLACGGVMRIGASHIGTAWTYISWDLSSCCLRSFLQASRQIIARAHDKTDLRRVQASVYAIDEKSKRFIEYLGFEYEGTMRQFGPEGQTALLYGHYRE